MLMMINDNHHEGREREENLVYAFARVILFHDQLQPIRQRLAEARTCACLSGSELLLNPRPTRFGPIRSCTQEATLLSSRIRYATVPSDRESAR